MAAVSVILPVFNAASTISRAIHSILHQTLTDLELIVVNDGSTDGTWDTVANIRDPRLRAVSIKHGGVASAANHAVTCAQAPVIARMDADDYAHPDRLRLQLQQLTEQNLDVIGSCVRIVDPTSAPSQTLARYQQWINEETRTSEQILALRFVEFPLVNPTILAKRSYFDLQCLDNDLPEDYDLMLRAAAAGMRFGKTPEVLLDWTDHPTRLTRCDARYSRQAFDRCRRQHLLNGPLQSARTVDLWGVGRTGKAWLRWLQSRGFTVRRAYEVNDRKVDTRIHGVLVQAADQLAAADGTPLLIAVGAAGARDLIRPQILARQYRPGRDAWFVS